MRLLSALVTAGLLFAAGSAASEDLRFGMSTALTGPASDLGVQMRAGVRAAFGEANRGGGVDGRQLELVSLDDGYEPSRTAPNMHRLIEQEEILGVLGNVGTPTAIAAVPIALRSQVPFLGAFTGAGVLRRSPPDRYVVNYRASYIEETRAMVDALIQMAGLRPEEIAFFTQRDGYGDAGFEGGMLALREHGLENGEAIAHGRYERNTTAVEAGLAEVLEARTPVRAVIMVGAYAPCAEFIQLAHEVGLEAHFLNVSFVGSHSLAEELREHGDGVIITQVVPHPEGDSQAARAYRHALAASGESGGPSFVSFEGYLAARMLILALDGSSEEVEREEVIDRLEALGSFDLGVGSPLLLSPDDHQASHRVWPTVIRNGEVVAFRWEDLRTSPAAPVP